MPAAGVVFSPEFVCLSIYLSVYPYEVCSLTKAQIRSMDYAKSSCYRKSFSAKSDENVRLCMDVFNCDDVDSMLMKRRQKFFVVMNTWTI